jgi:hypothetical protein
MTPAQDKHVTFLHLYLLTWVLLVFTTFGITYLKPGLGGGYLMSAWNVCVGLSIMMAGIAGVVTAGHEEYRAVGDEAYEELDGENTTEAVTEPDESTPLIQRSSSNLRRDNGEAETLAGTWWWIPQFIVSVPLPVILFSHVAMLLLDAMPQTIADGSPAVSGQFIHA